jgi:hypothetical protein
MTEISTVDFFSNNDILFFGKTRAGGDYFTFYLRVDKRSGRVKIGRQI